MSNTFSSFMRLVNNAVGAFKGLAVWFSQPITQVFSSPPWASDLLYPLFGRAIIRAITPLLQNVSMFDVLFSLSTVELILSIGIVRWFLDVLP